MALDSRDKRASALNVSCPWRGILPLPDGSVDDPDDRQILAFLYSGIAATGSPAPVSTRLHAIPFLATPGSLMTR